MRFFSGSILLLLNLKGDPPHPKAREKSFPVPIGIIPKVSILALIPEDAKSSTTHITVPSPPHKITLILRFWPFSIFLTVFVIFLMALDLF